MPKTLGPTQRRRMIRELTGSQKDMLEIAKDFNLDEDDVADWATQPENLHTLSGLCTLADLQTQLLLSRYRLIAASRLISIATDQDGGEASRRACVDLLKLDLDRAKVVLEPPQEHISDSLRDLLYGDNNNNDNNVDAATGDAQ
jgi:hypothetical protein